MDNFVNLAKKFAGGSDDSEQNQNQQYGQAQGQGYQQQQSFQGQGQQNFGVQGGPQFNAPHGGGGQQGNPVMGLLGMFNQETAVQGAQQNLGQTDPQTSSMFSQGMSFLQSYGARKAENPQAVDVNEDGVIDAHDKAYNQGQAGNLSTNAMGQAAAMQAMKMFMGGGGQQQQQSSGGNMQSKLIGMAFAEAVKLFSKSGGTSDSGSQQDVINSAGKTVMKLMLKSQMSGATGTGGGAGGLLSMASKFL